MEKTVKKSFFLPSVSVWKTNKSSINYFSLYHNLFWITIDRYTVNSQRLLIEFRVFQTKSKSYNYIFTFPCCVNKELQLFCKQTAECPLIWFIKGPSSSSSPSLSLYLNMKPSLILGEQLHFQSIQKGWQ